MLSYKRLPLAMLALPFLVWGCGGGADEEPEVRDLTLAPAESVATINDAPAVEPAPTPETQPAPTPTPPPARQPTQPQPRPKPTPTTPAPTPQRDPTPAPRAPTIAAGASMTVYATDTLTSRHNKTGETVTATIAEDVRDANGTVVIPAGAVFVGLISDLAPAGSPGGEGRMVLTFNRVEFGGQSYGIEAQTTSIASHMKGRGVTAGDAAKVGAGAVVGGIAGRIIGGNKKGTAIGAAAGAAAGVGIAAATRDVDIILDAGAPIELSLSAPFVLEPRRQS
jgi:hypothetical protein